MSGITVPRVVALWGVGNGVLVVVLVGYGENGFAIALYAAVVALLEVVALAAWLSANRFGERGARSPVGRRSDAALVAAAGCAFVGAGLVYSPWMMLPALYCLLWLAMHALQSTHRGGRDDDEAPTEAAESPLRPHAGVTTAAVVGSAAVATAVTRRRLLRRRRP